MDHLITLAARRTDEHPEWIGNYKPALIVGCVVPVAVYAALTVVNAVHIVRTKSLWWASVIVIGTACTAVGFAMRIWQRSAMDSISPFILQNLLVLISPATFLAWNYILFGRLMLALNGVDAKDPSLKNERKRDLKSPYTFIPPRIVGRAFVWSDVGTFMMQGAGGGLSSQAGGDLAILAKIGDKVVLVGVILQAVSYLLFTVLLIYSNVRLAGAHGRTYGLGNLLASLRPGGHPTARLYICFYFSSFCILVRSVFRSVELAQGYDGKLASTETFLLLLDALPLALAVGVWCIFWPTTLIDETRKAAASGMGPVEYAPMDKLGSPEPAWNSNNDSSQIHSNNTQDQQYNNDYSRNYKYEA